jgi:hypothetical protein
MRLLNWAAQVDAQAAQLCVNPGARLREPAWLRPRELSGLIWHRIF